MVRLAGLLVLVMVLAAAPASADEPYVDLVVTAEFDRAAYVSTDEIRLTVTVANHGTATATGVTLTDSGSLLFPAGWGELSPWGPGAVLAPGEQVRVTQSQHIGWSETHLRQDVFAHSAEPDRDPATNAASAEASMTMLRGSLSAVIHRDRDGDGRPDPGEGIVGVEVLAVGGAPYTELSARTDVNGLVRFPDLPAGNYVLEPRLPGGWRIVGVLQVEVGAGATDLAVPVVRDEPLTLSATMGFDRGAYAVGDTVRARVTITNTGAMDVSGVIAICEGSPGRPAELDDIGAGDLSPAGPGLTLRAGESRSFEFAGVVGVEARRYGYLAVECLFTTNLDAFDGPRVFARASVPGGSGSLTGSVYHDTNADDVEDPGEPALSGVTVVLADQTTGQGAASARTDALGRFRFDDVPAGRYEFRVLGAWRPSPRHGHVLVVADTVTDLGEMALLPGPTVLDGTGTQVVPPGPSAAPAALPAAARPAHLADTGVDVGGLAALGLLLVVSGAALFCSTLFLRRPRETS